MDPSLPWAANGPSSGPVPVTLSSKDGSSTTNTGQLLTLTEEGLSAVQASKLRGAGQAQRSPETPKGFELRRERP